MLRRKGVTVCRSEDVLRAIDRSLAIIEFDLTGKILSANPNFCAVMGYEASEIVGRHHSMFVEPGYSQGDDYRAFWRKLGEGEFDSREYKRIGKGGKEVWIQATYNPVRNAAGRVVGVVKAATDITEIKLRNAETEGKLNAISRAQAVIEFTPAGEIITANEAFLQTLGYRLDEIQGRHHRMFVEPDYAGSANYAEFWRRLNAGDFVAAEFKRLAKGGKEVWINASYNPIFDLNNRVTKVVKFATEVTERVRAVQTIGTGLSELADNNLEHQIKESFAPQFEELRLNFNRSVECLRAALGQVIEGAGAIQTGVGEIATASDNLSRRTEQQAASLEETAAALDEITATVQRSAEGARSGAAAASDAKAQAHQSSEVMREAVAAMADIQRSSTEISQIIGVIDEIAFQTNLLALNAGVEAARAGDAGKGFAVVASEVRALAQRSAEAAKEIKTLISSSSDQVHRGVKVVSDTGEALKGIVGRVGEIDVLIAEIARSSQEQATGLAQINTAINQMDQVTQQNAAMVEQSTAAAASLRNETTKLVGAVGRFRIGQRSAATVPASSAAEPARPPNPVGRSQTKLVAAFGRGAAAAARTADWEEF